MKIKQLKKKHKIIKIRKDTIDKLNEAVQKAYKHFKRVMPKLRGLDL